MNTYLYGKLTRNKFYTPARTYTHNTSFPAHLKINTYHPVLYTDKIQIFYTSPIFNTYVISVEENVTKLYSQDEKLTIIKKVDLLDSKMYTVKIVNETDTLRICEIYEYDQCFVGKQIEGKLEIRKNKYFVITPFGIHPCILQNNIIKKKIDVKIWKMEGNKMMFVEINNPIKGQIEVNINEIRDNIILVSKDNIRGVIISNILDEFSSDKICVNKENMLKTDKLYDNLRKGNHNKIKTKKRKIILHDADNKEKNELKTLLVYVREELLGFYIFDIVKKIKINDQIEAVIISKLDDRLVLKYQTYNGFIKLENIRTNVKNLITGKIIKIDNDGFEISQIQGISISFDEKIDSEEIVEKNSSDTINDIYNKIKKFAEFKRYDNITDLYYKIISSLSTVDMNNLTIVYINVLFLRHSNDEISTHEIINELKKTLKWCTNVEQIGLNTNSLEIIEYIFKKTKTRKLFYHLLKQSFINRKDTFNLIKNNLEYISSSIELIYKYDKNPKLIVEKVIDNSFEGWKGYIENESNKRVLFRRVINMKWKTNEMKEWFRMWMKYEKEKGNNVDEVREKAIEFVKNNKK